MFYHVTCGVVWRVLWEYGVQEALVRSVWSLHDQSRSLVYKAGSKLELFPVHVAPRQRCPLSAILFIIFKDRISRLNQGAEGV